MSKQNDKDAQKESGEIYPWLLERDKLLKEMYEREKQGEYELDEHGNRKVSMKVPIEIILDFSRVARKQPEIWGMMLKIGERTRKHPHAESTKHENEFFALFVDWFIAKHDYQYFSLGFLSVYALFKKIVRGEMTDNLDSKETRDYLLGSPDIYEEKSLGEQEQ